MLNKKINKKGKKYISKKATRKRETMPLTAFEQALSEASNDKFNKPLKPGTGKRKKYTEGTLDNLFEIIFTKLEDLSDSVDSVKLDAESAYEAAMYAEECADIAMNDGEAMDVASEAYRLVKNAFHEAEEAKKYAEAVNKKVSELIDNVNKIDIPL